MIVIVGGGLAGLAAAIELHQKGLDFTLLEAAEDFGGRVKTRFVEGYCLDYGFQVLNPSYPLVERYVSLEGLELGYFDSGALILQEGQKKTVYDVRKHFLKGLATFWKGYLKISDGLTFYRELGQKEEPSFEGVPLGQYLQSLNLSPFARDEFLTPFYRGITLDPQLAISHHFFRYTFQLFAKSRVGLPKHGMAALPALMAETLPLKKLRLQCEVASVEAHQVITKGGERIECSNIILAIPPDKARKLLKIEAAPCEYFSQTTYYYHGEPSPKTQNLLCLNGAGTGPINHIACLSEAQPHYAPKGKHLLSATVLGADPDKHHELAVKAHLVSLLGDHARSYQLLEKVFVKEALPQKWGQSQRFPTPEGVVLCGDFYEHPSIQGALASGQKAAEAVS